MRTATGIINQYIEIYSDQDYDNNSGGVIPNTASYWSTVAEVKQISAKRSTSQFQEIFQTVCTFTVSDRNDKNVRANMLLKWKNTIFTITEALPDFVYQQMLVITAATSEHITRTENTENIVEWFYADQDYHNDEGSIPDFQFSSTLILPVTSIQMDLTDASDGKYIGFRVPVGFEPTFTEWSIDETNSGTIPGFNWYAKATKNDHDYYLSRTLFFLNTGDTTLTVT